MTTDSSNQGSEAVKDTAGDGEEGDFTAEGCCPCCGDKMFFIEGYEDAPDVFRCRRCNKEMEA